MGGRSWPQVGRADDTDAVRAAVCGRGAVRGALLVGDAGVGKTSLARSVTESLRLPVHWVAGTESARDIPLGAFAHLLSTPVSGDPLTLLANAFQAIRREKYAVIGVDDVHLLDHVSATLLHQLAVDGGVRIVATARAGEPVPQTVTSLWKDGYLIRRELNPLSRAEVGELLERVVDGRVEQLTCDLIWQSSLGNALFVRHAVEGALEAGSLRCVRGVWQLRGQAPAGGFAPLLRSRLDRLPDDQRHALQLLAVCAPLPIDVVTGLVDTETLEAAERRGLIRIHDDAGTVDVDVAHAAIGEAIRHDLGAVATRRLQKTLLPALTARPAVSAADRMRVAELSLDAGADVDAADLVRAAEDAFAIMNITLAERFARAAAERDDGLQANELIARALLWQGFPAEAEGILSAFDPDHLDDIDLVRWGIARIANLQWSIGDSAGAAGVLTILRERISHPAIRLVVDGLESALLVLDGRLEEAVALADAVVDAPDVPSIAVAWAVVGGTMAAALMGCSADSARFIAHGHRVSGRIDAMLRFLIAFGEVRALALAGDFDAAAARSGAIVRITSPHQYRAWAMANVLAGTVDMGRGRLRSAMVRLEETVAALGEEDASSWNMPARWLLVQCYSGLGCVDKASALLAELLEVVDRTKQNMVNPPVRVAEAWVAAAEGHLSGAIAIATDAADLAAASGQRAIELMALHAAARFGDRASLPRLIGVARQIAGPLAEVDAAHATGLLNQDAGMVFSASREFERLGALLSAADAAAQAAAMFDKAGQRRAAVEAAAAADRLSVACGGLQTPALRLAAKPLPLSSREREIASLVAQGLTNRDIAERLVVSIRTVEGHLYRMFAKLDVADRDELATLIRRDR